MNRSVQRGAAKGLLPVLVLATVARVIWDLLIRVYPVSDESAYDLFARNLATGVGYAFGPGNPTAHWAVGTSFLYSLIYRIFGFHFGPIVVFTLFIAVATIWLTMLLADRWFGRDVAIATGLVLALWPNQIEFGTVLASELPFSFLLMAYMALDELWSANALLKGLVLGIIGAADCYVRPTAFLIPVILCVLSVLRHKWPLWPTAMRCAAIYVVMVALIAPWSIRNTRIFGQFVHISTNGGVNFWEGNNPTGDGVTEDIPPQYVPMNEAKRDQLMGKIGMDYVKQYPGRFVVRTIKKVYWLNNHETIGVHWNEQSLTERFGTHILNPMKVLNNLYWFAAFLSGIAGVVILTRRTGLWSTLIHPNFAMWAYFTAVHAIVVVQDRYHMPSVPYIAVFAAITIIAVRNRQRSNRTLNT